jgi:hypothetical protein
MNLFADLVDMTPLSAEIELGLIQSEPCWAGQHAVLLGLQVVGIINPASELNTQLCTLSAKR